MDTCICMAESLCYSPETIITLLILYISIQNKKVKKKKQNFFKCTLYACMLSWSSPVQLFVTPWTVAHQAPLSMEFSKQEYWSGLSFPSPGDLPDPEIEPSSPALARRFFTTWATQVLGVKWKVSFILDAGNWGREGCWTSIQRLSPTTTHTGSQWGKSFYRQKEGPTCRNSTVSSDSHLQIGHQWSDQCHLDCLRYN